MAREPINRGVSAAVAILGCCALVCALVIAPSDRVAIACIFMLGLVGACMFAWLHRRANVLRWLVACALWIAISAVHYTWGIALVGGWLVGLVLSYRRPSAGDAGTRS